MDKAPTGRHGDCQNGCVRPGPARDTYGRRVTRGGKGKEPCFAGRSRRNKLRKRRRTAILRLPRPREMNGSSCAASPTMTRTKWPAFTLRIVLRESRKPRLPRVRPPGVTGRRGTLRTPLVTTGPTLQGPTTSGARGAGGKRFPPGKRTWKMGSLSGARTGKEWKPSDLPGLPRRAGQSRSS